MNMARAVEVMERHNLDGLVLGDPVNVFHALGHWPQIARTRQGQPPGTFAILARERIDEPGLVTSRFLYYYTWADGRQRDDVQAWLYTLLDDAGAEGPFPEYELCPDRGEAPMSTMEQNRARSLSYIPADRAWIGDCGAAIVKAMRDLGIWGGRVGVDHRATEEVLTRNDCPAERIWADNVLREIRLIKSPLEMVLMARAAEANVQALNAVGRAVREGAAYHELHQLFLAEAAQRGNRAVFLNVDRSSSEFNSRKIEDGQALFLDAVSHFQHYHGDFARTVFVGDPLPPARKAAEAAALAGSPSATF